MKLKALTLGAALGLLAAISPSCGPTANCGANNCTGCCDANKACITADKMTDAVCGSAGNSCSNCSTQGQTCNTIPNTNTKSCIGAVATGGGSAAAGGGSAATGGGTSATGGGASAGGAGGGSAGGAAGGAALQTCDLQTNPTCPAGTECLLTDFMAMSTAGTCVPGECSVQRQDCAAPNTKCTVGPLLDGGLGRQCRPFTLGDGGVAVGAVCTPAAPDPCVKGSQCLAFQGMPNALCRKFCGDVAPCTGGTACTNVVGFQLPPPGGNSRENHLICSLIQPCNPFDQSPCTTNQACAVLPGFTDPICVANGTVATGAACGTAAFCARGGQCVVPSAGGAAGTCRSFCNLDGGAPTCTSGACASLMGLPVGTCN